MLKIFLATYQSKNLNVMANNVWCPECGNPVVFESNQFTVTGIGVHCPRCGYRGEKFDPRLSIHPQDKNWRCKFCRAHNEWDRVGDILAGGSPRLICRRCSGDQGQDQPPKRQAPQPSQDVRKTSSQPGRPTPAQTRQTAQQSHWAQPANKRLGRSQARHNLIYAVAFFISLVIVGIFAYLGNVVWDSFGYSTWVFATDHLYTNLWAGFLHQVGFILIFPLIGWGYVVPWIWHKITGQQLMGCMLRMVEIVKIFVWAFFLYYVGIFILMITSI